MSNTQLTDGSPVPADRSHTEIEARTGMQKGYVVLTPEERAKGFVKRVRHAYLHQKCGVVTSMGNAIAETYARNPWFYSGTYCVSCMAHFPLNEFNWEPDGEPMDPTLQDAWHTEHVRTEAILKESRRQLRILALKKELADLEAEGLPTTDGGNHGA